MNSIAIKCRVTFILLTCSLTSIASVSDKMDEVYCNYTAESNSYTCKDDSSCPTWFFYCNTETGKCQCGEGYHRMIACDEATGRAAVSNCHCVTYDNVTKETQVGSQLLLYITVRTLPTKLYTTESIIHYQ